MAGKTPPVHHSPEMIRKAAETLANDRASKLSRSLAGSILGALNQEEHQVCKPKPNKGK